ncbi:MAG: glycosyltransferase [Chloroflexi bacterium]|nr:glycosyltransferase [Chloroflexota bacterium]
MLEFVTLTPKALNDYRPVIGDELVDEIRDLAAPLANARVLHVNATPFGGGVAEILSTLVPLMSDLGLQAEWRVIVGPERFYDATKALHNSLQGMAVDWTSEMQESWLEVNRENAEQLKKGYDFVVIHDPQPAAMLSTLRSDGAERVDGKWVWRCHIDLTEAQPATWDLMRPYVNRFDGAIFTSADYVQSGLDDPRVFIVPPAIDPLSPKNVDMPDSERRAILERFDVDPDRPLIAQISRFDPWKDPLGVIEAYRRVKLHVKGLQLVLIASMAHDDPEGWEWYERCVRRAGEDFDIHVLSNLHGVGNVEVNAFQRSDVLVQKSIREGFGLVVSEGLWKERPVVAGNVGGIPLQLVQGETGYLVGTIEECAERVEELLADPALAAQMGAAGREFVRERFLITRLLADYVKIFRLLSGIETPPVAEIGA